MSISLLPQSAIGEAIDESMFGANVLFQINTPSAGFDATMKTFGVTNIRWPGGAISEGYFDPRNPDVPLDTSRSPINPQPFGDTVLTFTDAMKWAKANDVGMNIVLPTQHLIKDGVLNQQGLADIAWFVSQTLATGGKFADARIASFEIGNEYWGTQLTASEYGKIADAVVKTIDSVYDRMHITNAPDILVQTGNTYSVDFQPGGLHADRAQSLTWGQKVELANTDIIKELSPAAKEAITGAVSHYYYTDRGTNNGYDTTDPWTERLLKSIWEKAGITDQIHYTEWNVNLDFHKPQFAMGGVLIEQFETMIRMDAGAAYIWPVNQRTGNDLAGPNNDTSGLSINGAAYKLLADNITGMQLQNLNVEKDKRFESSLYVDDDTAVLFLSESLGRTLNTSFSLDGIAPHDGARGSFTLTQYTIMRDATMDRYVGTDQGAKIVKTIHTSNTDLSQIGLTFKPYEVIMLRAEWHGPNIIRHNAAASLDGTVGDDDIYAGRAGQLIDARDGKDRVFGSMANDTLYGGNGDDTVRGGGGNDKIYGGDGHDALYGGLGIDQLWGGNNNDKIHGGSGHDSLYGGNGSDILLGGYGHDLLNGGKGNDILHGHGGHDTLYGGGGHDLLDGGFGNDRLYGHNGNDTIKGGAGNDTLQGNSGNDFLDGGTGDDLIYGGIHFDILLGGEGQDTLWGQDGDDRLYGDAGNDLLYGGNGADLLTGGTGNDTLYGGAGNDILIGTRGTNKLYGDDGNDTFLFGHKVHTESSYGNNSAWGGTGADRFVFDGNAGWTAIKDFELGRDKIVFRDDRVDSMRDLTITSEGKNGAYTVVAYDGGRIRLDGVHIDDLSANDFFFV